MTSRFFRPLSNSNVLITTDVLLVAGIQTMYKKYELKQSDKQKFSKNKEQKKLSDPTHNIAVLHSPIHTLSTECPSPTLSLCKK